MNEPKPIPRCRVVPLADHQTSFQIDGQERVRWHYGLQYPRPFFFPFVGPGGSTLTRLGHPGAPDHDHHRSIWFAHEKVLGIDFWSDGKGTFIRQKMWLCYADGSDYCAMAVRIGWYDGHDPRELVDQELIAVVRPGANRETTLELQTTFRPSAESLEFGKTNFGFLAVRMAKEIAATFGGGTITNSAGKTGEKAIFGNSARWMDYSGSVPTGGIEGVTYFDHRTNPSHPALWHVRDDGWMGASVCRLGSMTASNATPLTLRYLLHAHSGTIDRMKADAIANEFNRSGRWEVVKSTRPSERFELRQS